MDMQALEAVRKSMALIEHWHFEFRRGVMIASDYANLRAKHPALNGYAHGHLWIENTGARKKPDAAFWAFKSRVWTRYLGMIIPFDEAEVCWDGSVFPTHEDFFALSSEYMIAALNQGDFKTYNTQAQNCADLIQARANCLPIKEVS